jgi:energy-coupling factor transport system substrate-specific component
MWKRFIHLLLLLLVIGALWLSIIWSNNYLLPSFSLIMVAILFTLSRFENRKLEAKELVLLAVLAAIAAVGRIPFASIPSIQPTTFVIMIAGLVFGAESGFMIGVVAALASNMILGQGPWTPWQMVSWGLVGMTAGLLRNTPVMTKQWGRIVFAFIWGFLFGWIMNLWSFFSVIQSETVISIEKLWVYFASSALFDFMHSSSTVLFLLLFGETWIKILNRFKSKYGILEK